MRQLDGDSTGSAPGIQNPGAAGLPQKAFNQIGFAVDALAVGFQPAPARVVLVAAGLGGVLPTGAHAVNTKVVSRIALTSK